MWFSPRSLAPGRRREYGPTRLPVPTDAPSMWQNGRICTPSAICASLMTQLAPIFTLLPITTRPSKTTFTSISTSCPQMSSPRKSNRSGSIIVTPASRSRLACTRCHTLSSRASCDLELIPSTSQACSGWTVVIDTPSLKARPITSVR